MVAVLQGTDPSLDTGRCVAVRADMDALPIMEIAQTAYRSENPGVMHACGHDVHMTCALGVAELLAKHRDQLHGSVKFLFQPAEEAMPVTFVGDWAAKLMIEQGALREPATVSDIWTPLHTAIGAPQRAKCRDRRAVGGRTYRLCRRSCLRQ